MHIGARALGIWVDIFWIFFWGFGLRSSKFTLKEAPLKSALNHSILKMGKKTSSSLNFFRVSRLVYFLDLLERLEAGGPTENSFIKSLKSSTPEPSFLIFIDQLVLSTIA
jgi:hypothetical protein